MPRPHHSRARDADARQRVAASTRAGVRGRPIAAPGGGRSGLERERSARPARHAELPVVLQRGQRASPDGARSLSRHTLGPAVESRTLACRIGAGLSTSESAWDAATEAAREARGGALGRAEVDLAFLFLSPAHLDEAEAAVEAVREELAPRHLLGCAAEGVVAGMRELEEGPGVAVWAGALPGAEIDCFHLAAVETDDGIAVAGLPELDEPRLVALLVDPFTFPVGLFLTSLNEAHERIPLVGGIAGGGRQPGAQALILDDAVHRRAPSAPPSRGRQSSPSSRRAAGRSDARPRSPTARATSSTSSPDSRRSSACVARSPPSPPRSKRWPRAGSSLGS